MSRKDRKRNKHYKNKGDEKQGEQIPPTREDKIFLGYEFKSKSEADMAKFICEKELLQIWNPKNILPQKDTEFINIVKHLVAKKVLPLYKDEVRMGILLIKNGILEFEYSKKFPTVKIKTEKRDNNSEQEISLYDEDDLETPMEPPKTGKRINNNREVDFYLIEPIKVVFCGDAVQAFEIKSGNLNIDSWTQRRELRDSEDKINTFMVLEQHLDFWETFGFTSLKMSPKEAFCGKINFPQNFVKNSAPGSAECSLKVVDILLENQINFKYSTEEGWENIFWLEKPTQIFWSSCPVNIIMVVPKGKKFTITDWIKRRRLISDGHETFMALPQHIYFWGKWGLTRQKRPYK